MYKTNIEKKIKQDILDTITISKEIKLEKWKKRTLDVKILEALLRLISPLL